MLPVPFGLYSSYAIWNSMQNYTAKTNSTNLFSKSGNSTFNNANPTLYSFSSINIPMPSFQPNFKISTTAYNIPIFNIKIPIPKFTYSTRSTNSNQRSAYSSRGISISGQNQNASLWKRMGYCANAGLKLAKTAINRAVGFIGSCAKYVKNAIAKCGLGKYQSGHAYNMVNIMRNNKKFKEISPKGVNLKTLPAGCVLVYGKGVGGYSSKYGHTEITTGDGRAVSDGITRNLHKTPTAIFMPISA